MRIWWAAAKHGDDSGSDAHAGGELVHVEVKGGYVAPKRETEALSSPAGGAKGGLLYLNSAPSPHVKTTEADRYPNAQGEREKLEQRKYRKTH
eukprot:scaffold54686_cov41-Prasinocladus_malaysianus.AAC.2